MRTTIIATVGISTFFGLDRINLLEEAREDQVQALKEDEALANRISAEINSINSILRTKQLSEIKDLYLLYTDTDKGRISKNIIEGYFKDLFHRVTAIEIEGFSPVEDGSFSEDSFNEGLRQLVTYTSQIIYKKRNKQEQCLINATGGFKAQVSFIGLIGQVFKIPVYYLFEGFSDIIRLPELPISVEQRLWLKHFDIFKQLYNLEVLPAYKIPKEVIGESGMRELLSLSYFDNKKYYRLSSVGVLMHELFSHSFKAEQLDYFQERIEKRVDEKGILKGFPKDIPLSLETLLESLENRDYIQEIKFVSVSDSTSWTTNFYLDEDSGEIEGRFSDGKSLWIFSLSISTRNKFTKRMAYIDLNIRYTNLSESKKPGSVTFILIRHGEHVGEADGLIEGWADFELTEHGRTQSRAVAKVLKEKGIDALFCSSLKRAQGTAEIIGEEIGLEPKVFDDLKAMNYGLIGGLKQDEASVLYPEERSIKAPHFRMWESESEIEFNSRILEIFYEIYFSHPDQTVAIVTHGRVISSIMREIVNLPFTEDVRVESEDTSMHSFKIEGDTVFLRYINKADHLRDIK